MLTGIVEIALVMMKKSLKKKKGKLYAFLIKEETQNTVAEIYSNYAEVVEELEDEEEK